MSLGGRPARGTGGEHTENIPAPVYCSRLATPDADGYRDAVRSTFHRLRPTEYAMLLVLLALGYLYAIGQRHFLPDLVWLRSFALLGVAATLLLVLFAIVRPAAPFALSRTLGLANGMVIGTVIVIQHFILSWSPSFKNLIVLTIAVLVPFIDGWIYQRLVRSHG
jgi:hypothetical protein